MALDRNNFHSIAIDNMGATRPTQFVVMENFDARHLVQENTEKVINHENVFFPGSQL